MRGWPAWLMHRAYHVSRVPTFNRKVRVCADWLLAGFFRREAVSLTSFENPREEFTVARRLGQRVECDLISFEPIAVPPRNPPQPLPRPHTLCGCSATRPATSYSGHLRKR